MDRNSRPEKAIIVAGPTAVGKSEFAAALAERYDGEVVSADSMQVYRGLDIGTAKPSRDLLARVPHQLIGVVDPAEPFSVAEYRARAEVVIRDIFARGRIPVIAGGTGLYIHALLFDMDFSGAGRHDALREKYESQAERFGNLRIYDILKERDPEAAARIHPNNRKRVVRALERLETGDEEDGLRDFARASAPSGLFDPVLLILTRDREELRVRIDERTDALMRAGLADEVRGLRERGLSREHISMLGIGYKELLAYLEGEYDEERAVELIKLHTRRYAKRQVTWFKRYADAETFNLSAYENEEAALRAVFLVADAAIGRRKSPPDRETSLS
ncbi:MAG: tRNA (adenosine(37)-N6)-dimethylallyltransferase MiaA [Clostridiales Family XIII bacterium]|jgi:tRNA dimethylallyltransferase|nr:tRNA (adenosine(37)-N6)-dimethylallyltransferase MiaA [Clostridiales Family XIII bacterium]